MPIPAFKHNELIEKFNAIAKEPVVNQLALQRYKHEVNRLKTVPPEIRLSLLGMIACLEKEYGEMRKFHERAIVFGSTNYWVLAQYASSLARADYYEESFEYAVKAFNLNPLATHLLPLLINTAELSGLKEECQFYSDKLKAIQGEGYTAAEVFFRGDDPEYRDVMLDCLEKKIEEKDEFVRVSDAKFAEMLELANEIEALS